MLLNERAILQYYFSENIDRETEENKTDTYPRNENPRLRVLKDFMLMLSQQVA